MSVVKFMLFASRKLSVAEFALLLAKNLAWLNLRFFYIFCLIVFLLNFN